MILPPVVRAYLDAYNAKNVEGMLACLAEDVTFRNISDGAVTAETAGKAAFAALAAFGVEAFASRHQAVTAAITVETITLAEIDYTAVVARDLPNGWQTGQQLAFRGASMFRVEAGLIIELVDQS